MMMMIKTLSLCVYTHNLVQRLQLGGIGALEVLQEVRGLHAVKLAMLKCSLAHRCGEVWHQGAHNLHGCHLLLLAEALVVQCNLCARLVNTSRKHAYRGTNHGFATVVRLVDTTPCVFHRCIHACW